MNKYYITSSHDVYKFSYEDGEQGYANGYFRSTTIKAETPKDAVRIFIELELCFEVEPNDITYEGNVYINVMVDEDGLQAYAPKIESWKNGLCPLYQEDISISVSKLEPINF
jgi:hypothetical protein